MAESSIKAGWSLILFVSHSLLHTNMPEDVSTSLQGSSPNVKSIVLSLPSGDRVTATHVHTHPPIQGLRWFAAVASNTRSFKHGEALQQQRLTAEKN